MNLPDPCEQKPLLSSKKKLLIQKYLDMYGRGLKLPIPSLGVQLTMEQLSANLHAAFQLRLVALEAVDFGCSVFSIHSRIKKVYVIFIIFVYLFTVSPISTVVLNT